MIRDLSLAELRLIAQVLADFAKSSEWDSGVWALALSRRSACKYTCSRRGERRREPSSGYSSLKESKIGMLHEIPFGTLEEHKTLADFFRDVGAENTLAPKAIESCNFILGRHVA